MLLSDLVYRDWNYVPVILNKSLWIIFKSLQPVKIFEN